MQVCNVTDPKIASSVGEKLQDLSSNYFLEMWTPDEFRSNLMSLMEEFKTFQPLSETARLIYQEASDLGWTETEDVWKTTFPSETALLDYLSGSEKEKIDNEADADKITSQEYNQRRSDIRENFLYEAFGHATRIRMRVEREATEEIVNASLVRRTAIVRKDGSVSPGQIITTNLELNDNLRRYQQSLLNKIVLFIRNKYSDKNLDILNDTRMYKDNNGNLEYTGIFHKLVEEFGESFKSASPDTLISWDSSTDGVRKQQLEAYIAYHLLAHFDSLMDLNFGKSIVIDDFADNAFTGKNKYSIADKGANNKTTWRTTEEIVLEQEVDTIVQKIISTTPRYNYRTKTQYKDAYLRLADLSNAIAKIKDLAYAKMDIMLDSDQVIYDLGLSNETVDFIENHSLKSLINNVRVNPQKTLPVIFELLSNEEFRKYAQKLSPEIFNEFLQHDWDTIYSLYKGIFNPKLSMDQTEYNSLYAINKTNNKTNYYSYITQACDSIFSIKFLQYYKNQNGQIVLRNMKFQEQRRLERNIEQVLQNLSSRISGTAKTREIQYNITHTRKGKELDYVSYTLPIGGVKVKIQPNGTVTFIQDSKTFDFQSITNEQIRDYLLPFINEITGLDLDLTKLELLCQITNSNKQNKIKDLVTLASHQIYSQRLSSVLLEKNKTKQSIIKALHVLVPNNVPQINTNLREINLFNDADYPLVKELAYFKMIQQGLFSGSQIKSGTGDSQSAFSLSRFLGSIPTQFEVQNRQNNSATNQCMLITEEGLLQGIYTAKEYYDGENTNDHTKFNVGEFAYAQIVQDYMLGMSSRTSKAGNQQAVGNGIIAFIPSVNSDKGTIGRILIDTNKQVRVGGILKKINELNSQEFEQLIKQELGMIYSKALDNINEDFDKLFTWVNQQNPKIPVFRNLTTTDFVEFNQTFGENAGKKMKQFIAEYNLAHPVNPIHLIDQVHYLSDKKNEGFIMANQTFLSYLYRYADIPVNSRYKLPTQSEFWNITKAKNLKSLINAGFKVDLVNTDGSRTEEVSFINEKLAGTKWIDASTSEVIPGFFTLPDGRSFRLKTRRDGKILAQALQDTVKQAYTTQLIQILQNIANEAKESVSFVGGKTVVTQGIAGVIDASTAKYYLRYLERNKRDGIKKAQSLQKKIDKGLSNVFDDIEVLNNFGTLELNPLLEQYQYMDYLFSQEFMISAIGSCIAHPAKGNINTILEEEAARFNAQHKRNVSYTAAMQEFQLGLLEGIPRKYNIAILSDITDKAFNVSGDVDTVKPFDGATFVNPFIVYLENYSLGGAKAGITKKQFVHFYDHRTGTGGIIKTAGFGLTNNWIRESKLMRRMMKQMTDRIWMIDDNTPYSDLDITKQFNSNREIEYDDMYYMDPDSRKYYKITNIKYANNNSYNVTREEVDEHGNSIGESETIFVPNVNSNYKLWNMFGGAYSMSLQKSGRSIKLLPSETSITNVVKAINNVGFINPASKKTIDDLLNGDDVIQPLKTSDIHYCPTEGAVKQGASNINPATVYTDDNAKLNFMTINMNQAGIQLDKEHHADGAELSLMTQVISSCAHAGYTMEQALNVYKALATLATIGTDKITSSFEEYFTSPENKDFEKEFIGVVQNTVIKALSRQQLDDSSLLNILAADLIEEARKGKNITFAMSEGKIAVDNPQVYGQFLSTLSVFLTNAAIKIKVPGILSVLTPSHEIMKLYGGKKWSEIVMNKEGLSAEAYIAKLQQEAENNPIVDQLNGIYNLHNIKLNRWYYVTTAEGVVIPREIVTPTQYHQLKNEIKSGKIIKVVEAIDKGRNLSAYNAVFEGENGEKYQLYDIDSIVDLYDLKQVLDSNDLNGLKAIGDKYEVGYNPDPKTYKSLIEKTIRKQVRKDMAVISPNGEKFFEGNTVKINGQDIIVNKNSIEVEPYELILPKTFATEFGLSEYDQVSDIIDNPEWFIQKQLENFQSVVSDDNFDIELKRTNGDHVYIIDKQHAKALEGLTEVNIKTLETSRKKKKGDTETSKQPVTRVDKYDKDMYLMSSKDDKVYIDTNGHEIIITDNVKFYIDNFKYNFIRISESTSNNQFDKLVNLLKGSRRAKGYLGHLHSFELEVDDQKNKDKIRQARRQANNVLLGISNLESLRRQNAGLFKQFRSIGYQIHSSFLKSLECIGARIPAQSQQSFMPMRVVAFDNPNINTAYVNTAQIWLQGSDYA